MKRYEEPDSALHTLTVRVILPSPLFHVIEGKKTTKRWQVLIKLKNKGWRDMEPKHVISRKRPRLGRGKEKLWKQMADKESAFCNHQTLLQRLLKELANVLHLVGSTPPLGSLWCKGESNTCILTPPALGWEWWLQSRQGDTLLYCVSFWSSRSWNEILMEIFG